MLLAADPIGKCRLCRSAHLDTIIDLGAQPPANSLRHLKSEELPRVPLALCRCASCGGVQLTHTVAPEFLFKNYIWVTGTSATAKKYGDAFCSALQSRSSATAPGLVIEIASNDGTFLRPFSLWGWNVLGIDPADNIARLASDAGIPTRSEFFGTLCAKDVVSAHGRAKMVFARNVLPHVPDPTDIVQGMSTCLDSDGIGAIEFHRADIILGELHYNSIYHEHVFYYSLRDVEGLLQKAQLFPFDIMESPISGGSWVVFFSKRPRDEVVPLSAREAENTI